ncbi:MAG: cation:proton antiporter domain-containing protein [Candidatus Hodarchaeales archaeon]|jgi:cell volume regulation protein A
MLNTDNLLLLVSSTLLLSYISNLMYNKTNIPDIVWLLGFGIILGPVLGYFDNSLFISLSPLMSTVALSIILFDAGIHLDITVLIKAISKATVLSLSTILSVILAVGYALNYIMPSSFTLLEAMLLGAMIGGTSTIAVISVFDGLQKIIPDIESTRLILTMESVISDPVCIIASITIIKMIMMPGVTIFDSIKEIISTFTLSSVFGLAIGQIWAEVLDKLQGRSLNYIMTLSILFPTYILAEHIIGEGGGPMAALTFGLMLTNYRNIARRVGVVRNPKIDKERLREFHEEITYFIKAFFFVYIGLIVTISRDSLTIGLGVLTLILFIRYIVVVVVGKGLSFSKQEQILSMLIYASGLPAFVMSQLPLILDPNKQFFHNPEIYPNLVMPIVLGTVLFAAISAPPLAKRILK